MPDSSALHIVPEQEEHETDGLLLRVPDIGEEYRRRIQRVTSSGDTRRVR